jgi:UDP-N-acetylglucosamine--N-acetylmuramyl-(pentapeptide) pyrophosphoryl-undecaprenol N-acetylglucosamine transferase
MKIIIIGGHLAPALAVIQSLPKETQILYIGRKYALEGDKALSLEYQKITSMGIPFINLTTGRLQRKFTKHTIKSLFKLPLGSFQALKELMKFRPDCVVCFGGYVQVPVAFVAFILGIPIIIHEQTRKVGLANKIIAPFATAICISWEESEKYFPKNKTILTGIPLRQEFLDVIAQERNDEAIPSTKTKTIYITGGSLGAHAINLFIESCIKKLLEKNFYIVHQTGDAKEFGDYDRLEKLKQTLPQPLRDKYKLVKFIDPSEAAQAMASADLVISRSGMNTTAELLCLNKPCILIPLPHSQNNEQLENALFLQEQGLAEVLKQEDLTPEILYSQITSITDKLNKTDKSSRANNNSPLLTPYDAAKKIVQIITQIYKQKNQQKKNSKGE